MAAPYAWDVETDTDHDGPDGADVYASMSPGEAAAELVELLTFLKHSGKLPAIYASQIAWFASRAGAVDATLAKMGLPPGRQSGAYSRKFDRAIDIDLATEHEWYEVGVPTYGKYDGTRSITQLKVINPHDVLAAEFNTPAARAKLAAATLPSNFEGHPVRAAAGGDHVFPFSLYLDGVAFANRDSILGVHLWSVATGLRVCIAVILKSQVCRCGCRGWCTMYPLWSWLYWSVLALARGIYPCRRHDLREFCDVPSDGARSIVAGTPLGSKGACTMIKGDWAEYVTSVGFFSWSASEPLHACPLCASPKTDFLSMGGFTVDEMPFLCTDYAEYAAACARAEIRVTVRNAAELVSITRQLTWDKSEKGQGRILRDDIPRWRLLKGDRLEPSPTLLDIDLLESVTEFGGGYTIVFWRQTLATAVKRRNPLFCEELGISPHRSMTGDWLHALSLGTFQVWIMHVWHMIIARDVWRHGGTQEFKLAAGAKRILAELSAYYNGLPTAQRDRVSQLRELSAKMIGTREDPSYKLKGGEANGVLPFIDLLLTRYPAAFGDDILKYKEISSAMLNLLRLIRTNPVVFPAADVEAATIRAIDRHSHRPN